MINKLLRLEDEKFEYFKEIEIHDILIENTKEILNNFKSFYIEYSKQLHKVTLPKKIVIDSQNYKGDFRVMPCCIDDKIKSVKIIGTNEEEKYIKDKICVGKSFLIDEYDNYIYAMFDVCVLSSFRTAIISILAYDFSCKKGIIGIVGLGRIGFYTAYILHKFKNINQFYCVEIDDNIKNNFSQLASLYMPDVKIEYTTTKNLNNVCSNIFLTTNSKTAILNKTNSSNFNFISSVGADANNLSELSEDIISTKTIITDSMQSTLLGDLKKWKDKELISEGNIFELTDIIKNKNTIKNKQVLFISTGIALQDALISNYIYDKLTKNKNRKNK